MDLRSDSVVHPSWLEVLSDPVRLSVLDSLSRLGVATTVDLMSHTHTSDRTLRRHLDALVSLGVVRELPGQSDGETPGRPADRFALEPRIGDRVATLLKLLEQPLAP
jgi:DNA-binding transcriptional ArsR family regulator